MTPAASPKLSARIPWGSALGLCTAAALWVGSWTVFADSLASIGAVAAAAMAVLFAQIGVLIRTGRRLDHELLGQAEAHSDNLDDWFLDTGLSVVVHTLAAAALVGPLFVVIGAALLGVAWTQLLPMALLPFGIAQVLFCLSTFICVRGILRRFAIDSGVAAAATPSPKLVRVMVGLTFLVPIPLALLLVISAAGNLYRREASAYHEARLRAQAHALFVQDGLPLDPAIIDNLTAFDGYRPVPDVDAAALIRSGRALAVRAVPDSRIGIAASMPCSGLPWPITIGLVLVAMLSAGLAAAKVFTVMTGARRQLTERLDALPERLIDTPFDRPLLELLYFDDLLARLKARFDEMRQRQRRSIETGRKDRELKAQFFAGMSHDLRSPLNSIIGFTDLLLGGIEGELTGQQKQAVMSVSAEAEKLMSLIADILDTSKLDAGRFDLERCWVPPVEIVSGCTAEARRMVGTKNIEITPAVQAGLPPVYVDKGRIQQALIGLISRATQNARSGAFRIKAVSERMETGEQMLRIDIIDAAVTLSQTERMLISEAIANAASIPARSSTGALGLGIALARDLIHLHRGELVVHSSGATVFSVRLPLDEPASRD